MQGEMALVGETHLARDVQNGCAPFRQEFPGLFHAEADEVLMWGHPGA
jgi:hypothetical protein